MAKVWGFGLVLPSKAILERPVCTAGRHVFNIESSRCAQVESIVEIEPGISVSIAPKRQ